MKGYKITDTNFNQEVNLPAGTYTYSCRVIPVGVTYTFMIDSNLFTFEDLVPGVLSARIKYTFELTEPGVVFHPSNTLGDSVFEPQIEEGVFATTPGAHALDFERLISEAGIEIDHEALSLYAKKADVSAEIKIQADQINSTVGGLSNDVDELSNDVEGLRGSITSIEQTTTSISATVSNHTSQIAGFQITIDQIYAAIEDAGSGEFSGILQRLDFIEAKVGAPGKSGTLAIQVDSISAIVSDVDVGLSALSITVGNISTTVYNQHGVLLSQISQDGENVLIQASKIKLEGLVTANQNFKILADGSIEAKNGKFTGTITSTSGTIGGFQINASSIGTGSSWNGGANGMSLWEDFIVFNSSGRQALIGATSSLGFEFLGRFSDTNESILHKTGVIFNVRGSTGYNTAISLNAGHISGLAVRSRRVSTSVTLNQADVYISCYNSSVITIYLPSMPEEGKIVIIKRMNSASITFNGNGKIIEWGVGQGSSKAADGGVGDTHVFIWDGQFWNYNYMIRQSS